MNRGGVAASPPRPTAASGQQATGAALAAALRSPPSRCRTWASPIAAGGFGTVAANQITIAADGADTKIAPSCRFPAGGFVLGEVANDGWGAPVQRCQELAAVRIRHDVAVVTPHEVSRAQRLEFMAESHEARQGKSVAVAGDLPGNRSAADPTAPVAEAFGFRPGWPRPAGRLAVIAAGPPWWQR